MPDVSLYYVQTGYVEPGYFISEPAPPTAVKIEKLTIYKDIDDIIIYKDLDGDIIYMSRNAELTFRPINRTIVDILVTEV